MLIGIQLEKYELFPQFVELNQPFLDQSCQSGEGSWGMGFYQNGDVLLKKQPLQKPTGFSELVRTEGVVSSSMIVHHKSLGEQSYKYAQSHPFRYRSLLFAHEGFIPQFEKIQPAVMEVIPDFIARNIRGLTDSEHLFHLFLAFLRDSGCLEMRFIPGDAVITALRSTVALVKTMLAQANVTEEPGLNMLLLTGQFTLAARGGLTMSYRRVPSFSLPMGPDGQARGRFVKYSDVNGAIVGSRLSGLDASWKEMPDRSWLLVGSDGEITEGAL